MTSREHETCGSPGEGTRPGPPRRMRWSTKLPSWPYRTSCRADAGSSHQTPFGSCLPLLPAPADFENSALLRDPGPDPSWDPSDAGCGWPGVASASPGLVPVLCGCRLAPGQALDVLFKGCNIGRRFMAPAGTASARN